MVSLAIKRRVIGGRRKFLEHGLNFKFGKGNI